MTGPGAMSSLALREYHGLSLFLFLFMLCCTVTANYPLPPFWTQLYAPDGTPYYFNQQTGVSQYNAPVSTEPYDTYDPTISTTTSEAEATAEYNTYASQQSTATAWSSETAAWGSGESSQQYMQQYATTQQTQEGYNFDGAVDPADVSDDEGWYDDRFRNTQTTATTGSSAVYQQQGKQKRKSFQATMDSFKSSISSIKDKLTPR